MEEMPANKNQALIQSPSLSATHVDTPAVCDIITCAAYRQDGGAESRIQVDPGEHHLSSESNDVFLHSEY